MHSSKKETTTNANTIAKLSNELHEYQIIFVIVAAVGTMFSISTVLWAYSFGQVI